MRPLRDGMQAALPRVARAWRNQSASSRDREQHRSRRHRLEHESGSLIVAHLAFGEQHDARAVPVIADGVRLGVQATSGAPDTSGKSPFFSRLAAVLWAFRCVASIIN